MMRRRSLLVLVLLMMGMAGSLMAQSGATGTILGSVKDSTGAVIPGASVTVINTGTGVKQTIESTSAGDFTLPNLIPGAYRVTAEASGFSKEVVNGIVLVVDQQARVNMTLKPGSASEVVEVSASAVELDTDNSAISQLVSSQQVGQLPLNGRNFMDLLFIGTGAVQTGGEQATMRAGKGSAISIDGSRPESNNYLLDGMLNTDQALNTPSVVLSVDAIEQFKVLSSTYSAQYGFGANQISIVSKSGSNKLHGSLFEFDRNNAFDAENYFQAGPSATLRQNQFGFVVDGPVRIPHLYNGRDKSFWMANYEGWRIKSASNTGLTNVPTAANIAGDFSTSVIDPTTGEPFPGGNGYASIIPTARFSRLAKVTIGNNFIPAPNCTSGCQGFNYRYASTSNLSTNQQTYRIDQDMGKWGRVFGRGTYAHYVSSNAAAISGPIGGTNFTEVDANWMASHSFNITPNLINQFSIGQLDAYAVQSGGHTDPALQGQLAFANAFTGLSDLQLSYPNITFGNLNGENLGALGGPVNAYTYSDNPMWQFQDGVTYIHGAHTLQVGADYKRWTLYRDVTDDFLGAYNFDNYATGNEVGDFLLGTFNTSGGYLPAPLSVPGSPGNEHHYKFSYFAGYLQDDWKVDSKLTLNLGLRWDLRAVPYEEHNRMGWLDPQNANGGLCIADKSLTTNGIAPAGNGFYRYCGRKNPAKNELSDFAPRIGGAYRINNKTVARAGFGIFWDGVEGREIDDSGDIYPYVVRQALNQNIGQTSYVTTDSLFQDFSQPLPVTGGPNGPDTFLAVIISEKPKNPYVMQWSASIERELAKDTTLEINYVGNKGNRLLARTNINQAYAPQDPASCNVTPLPANCAVTARRPYSNFVTYLDSIWNGYSNYNSLNVKLEHRTSQVAITSVYTWAKNLDDKSSAASAGAAASGWQGFLNNHDPALDYGRSDFNVGQRFVTSFVYNLPFGRGKKYATNVNHVVDEVIGGWETTGIVTFQQGFPMSIQANDAGGLLDTYGVNRANYQGSASKLKFSVGNKYAAQNLALFSQPAFATYGTSGRNIATMPGIANYDIGVFKNFAITERANFQVRFEAFNAFNHPQFYPNPQGSGGGTTVVNNVTSAIAAGEGTTSNFGQINGAAPPRILQISGKFTF